MSVRERRIHINYREIERNRKSYKSDYEMFILNFKEILWGKGYDNTFIKDMLEHIQNLTPFFLHQGVLCHCPFLLELFTPLVELGNFSYLFCARI